MINFSKKSLLSGVLILFFPIGLASCSLGMIRPANELNVLLKDSARSHREPSFGMRWLVTLANHKGRDRVELIDLRSRRSIPTPGLNRPNAQPISVSISANGERIALVSQLSGQTELFLYRRNVGVLQRLEIIPKGVPGKVSLDGFGKLLAVQVSRDGRWEIDLIRP